MRSDVCGFLRQREKGRDLKGKDCCEGKHKACDDTATEAMKRKLK